MTSSNSKKIAKLKKALENVFVKKTDIKDNLTSTDTNKPLSAKQGKILDTNKVDKISGKSLSTNDFTNTYKTKLDNLDTLLENKANNTHTHGNLQNDGSIGISNNINKNVVTDGNGKITTEDKPQIDNTVTQSSSNAVKSSGIYSALAEKQINLSSLSKEFDAYGNSIFNDYGGCFYVLNDMIYYAYGFDGTLHFINSFGDDVNFDDIILEGDSRLTDARTPTNHSHSISNITNLQTSLDDKAKKSDLLDLIYPIGSIYMEKGTGATIICPIEQTLGGTLTRIENRFLYASENGQGVGVTGGSADSVVVSHNHTQNSHTHKGQKNIRFVVLGDEANWSYTPKIKIRTDGSGTAYYYPHSDTNKGGIGENYETVNATPTINSTGESGTNKNMPPYLAVNIWKRTA